jgi:hypothetical protein
MIVKDLEHIEPVGKLEQAGHYSESQLAFYLKREFKDEPQILVFNNLRLQKGDDACQIDHLVLHQHGMIIIESKSVTTRVEVNALGEWKRWFNNAWQGMPSPILQAQRQGKFLKDYLEDHVESLLNKLIFGRQAHFTKMPVDVLVAISDSGIIDRPKNDKLENVAKADQIADKVKAIIAGYRKQDRLLSLSLTIPYDFRKDELPRISDFLLVHHKSAKVKASVDVKVLPIQSSSISSPSPQTITANPIATKKTESYKPVEKPLVKLVTRAFLSPLQNICSHCQSKNLTILYAHSYYFRCNDCGKNTVIKNICVTCGDRERTRKSGLQFFSECEKCNSSRLFHTNTSA